MSCWVRSVAPKVNKRTGSPGARRESANVRIEIARSVGIA